jgi:DNA repair protein RadC
MYRRLGGSTCRHLEETVIERQMASVPICRVQLIRQESCVLPAVIDDCEDAAEAIAEHLAGADREHFVILMLDAKNHLLGIHTVSIGTLTATLVGVREVFKAAILANACAIIAGHNHPSGVADPSAEDYAVSEVLQAAGELLNIDLLDHIIVGQAGNFVSMRRIGPWAKTTNQFAALSNRVRNGGPL